MNAFSSFFYKIKTHFSKIRSRYLFEKRRESFQQNSSVIFHEFCNAFKESEVEFWLTFGTLLGSVRENGIISHDIDIDVGVKSDINYARLDESLGKHGFIKRRQIDVYSRSNESQGFEMTYSKDGVNIDIFIFHPIVGKENRYYTHAFFDRIVHENFILYKKVYRIEFPLEGLTNTTFMGNNVLIPSNYDSFLSSYYGPDYMIPNPHWKLTDSYSGYIIENSIGLVKIESVNNVKN